MPHKLVLWESNELPCIAPDNLIQLGTERLVTTDKKRSRGKALSQLHFTLLSLSLFHFISSVTIDKSDHVLVSNKLIQRKPKRFFHRDRRTFETLDVRKNI